MIADIFSVRGKVALVTGAAAGLGRAMAEALAENGARLAQLDRRPCPPLPGALTLQADITAKSEVEAAIARVLDHFGRLDILVANAGVSDPDPAPLHLTTDEGWAHVLDTNLQGTFLTVRAALRPMVAQGGGKIITVASMWGLAAPAGLFPRPAYAASKGAIVNLTRELALEYAPHNIQVNALCPGFFRTESRPRDAESAEKMVAYTPLGRLAEAHEIKGSLLYLASSASDFVTGTALVIDGGVLAR